MEYNEKIKIQIMDASERVSYTYTAHWTMVDRLKTKLMCIKVTQIVLTAVSTVGFLSAILTQYSSLNWISSLTAAVSLGLNLYTLNFNLGEDIKQHTDAANELWVAREAYRSLITDFDTLSEEEIKKRRDELTTIVDHVNTQYRGTDKKSYDDAKRQLEAKTSFS